MFEKKNVILPFKYRVHNSPTDFNGSSKNKHNLNTQ